MTSLTSNSNSSQLPQAGAAIVLLAALVIGGAFLMSEHNLTASRDG